MNLKYDKYDKINMNFWEIKSFLIHQGEPGSIGLPGQPGVPGEDGAAGKKVTLFFMFLE